MTASLYERLGETAGITRIANDIVDLHAKNPKIAARFAGSDLSALKTLAAEFFIAGSGGPQVYTGRDMLETHRHMNISDEEFMAVMDDAMTALDMSAIGDAEKADVLYIFYSLRPQIAGV